MKKGIKNKFVLLILVIALTFLLLPSVFASAFSLIISQDTLKEGETLTLTVNTKGLVGTFSVSTNDKLEAEQSSIQTDGTQNAKVKITAKAAGQGIIKVRTVSVKDLQGNVVEDAQGCTVLVKEENISSEKNQNMITNTTTKEKSTNKALKSLSLEPGELISAFEKETTSYEMTVGSDINEVKVNAVAEDEKATVTVSGNTELKEGINTIKIEVKAEDETIRTYRIDVTKQAATELQLTSLKIDGYTLNPSFNSTTYEYKLEIKDKKDITSLKIDAKANQEDATIEILGNQDFKDGENTVTIVVKSKEGEKTLTYQIKANKVTTAKEEKTFDTKTIVGVGIAVVVIIVLIIVLVRRRNREEEDDEDEFYSEPIYTRKDTIEEVENDKEQELPNGRTVNLQEENPFVIRERQEEENVEEVDKKSMEDTKEIMQRTGKFDRQLDEFFKTYEEKQEEEVEEEIIEEKKKRKHKGKHF